MGTTTYLGAIVVPDGFNGHTVTLHLCHEQATRCVLAVFAGGFFTWRN